MSDPASNMSVKVTDQNGEDVPVVVEKMMVRSSLEIKRGFISSISFGILLEEGMKHLEIECRAANDVCEVASLHRTKVFCKYANSISYILNILSSSRSSHDSSGFDCCKDFR